MNHREIQDKLKTAKSEKLGKPLCYSTRIYKRHNGIAIRHHDSDIVLFHTNGDITIDTRDSKGKAWHSITTKARLNEFIEDFNIWTENRIPYCSYKGKSYIFKDGMKLLKNGKVEGAEDIEKAREIMSIKRKIDKKVNSYIKGFIEDIKNNGLDNPGSGDCWYCLGKMGDHQHIVEHIEESYYVPSLLFNAISAKGTDKNDIEFTWTYGKSSPHILERYLRSYLGQFKLAMTTDIMEEKKDV